MAIKKSVVSYIKFLAPFTSSSMLVCLCAITAMTAEVFGSFYVLTANSCDFQTTRSQQFNFIYRELAVLITLVYPWGCLADVYGRRKVLKIGMTTSFIFSWCAAASPNYFTYCTFKCLSIAMVSCGYPVSQVLLAESSPHGKRCSTMILTTTIFLMAYGTVAAMAGWILNCTYILNIQFNSWRWLSLFYGVPSGIAAIAAAYCSESPIMINVKVSNKKPIQIASKCGFVHRLKVLTTRAAYMLWSQLTETELSMFGLYFVYYVCFYFFVFSMENIVSAIIVSAERGDTNVIVCQRIYDYINFNSSSSNQTAIPNCNIEVKHLDLVIINSFCLGFMNILFSALVTRVGRKAILVGLQCISGVAIISVNYSTHWLLSLSMILLYVLGLFNYGLLTSFSIDLYPAKYRCMYMALLNLIGSSYGLVIHDLLNENLSYNCKAFLSAHALIALFGALLATYIENEQKKIVVRKYKVKRTNKRQSCIVVIYI